MDFDRIPPIGLSLEDCCLIYDPQSSGDRQCRLTKQIATDPAHSIYAYIARPLSASVFDDALARVGKFTDTAFCDNVWPLECTIAGISLALMGQNVDRASWSIGKGGVGKALFSTLIRNAMSPAHGFFDCTSLYGIRTTEDDTE